MSGIGTAFAAINLAARFPRASRILGSIPKPVWEALIVLAYVAALVLLHQHYASAAIEKAVNAAVAKRDQEWQGRFDHMRDQALRVKQKAEAAARKISSNLKEQHDAQVRHNASDARDLQLRGPGKAAAPAGCRPVNYPGLSAAAGGSQRPAGAASTAANPVPAENGLSGLPAQRFGIVPWSWLVVVGQNSDDTSDEALKWRNWYVQQYTAWEQIRGSTPAKP